MSKIPSGRSAASPQFHRRVLELLRRIELLELLKGALEDSLHQLLNAGATQRWESELDGQEEQLRPEQLGPYHPAQLYAVAVLYPPETGLPGIRAGWKELHHVEVELTGSCAGCRSTHKQLEGRHHSGAQRSEEELAGQLNANFRPAGWSMLCPACLAELAGAIRSKAPEDLDRAAQLMTCVLLEVGEVSS